MKILHTSDWHLGQKFLYNDREAEHQLALDWLVQVIQNQQIDGLIVAGDVFDITNPPNYARRLYYNFLTALLKSNCCNHVLIIGGNHDSPNMLDAPKELLRALNMHVIGAATGNLEDQIIEWKDKSGKLEAVVAAVPFLRDGDLRYSVAGETGYERIARMRDGILRHYQQLGELLERYQDQNIPIIGTGHLYVKGAFASERQDNIYIGDTANIETSQFPDIFNYVALGHIHRAQAVNNVHHIRYAGSLIPLNFSETKDDKSVYIVEFQQGQLQNIETIPVPTFRRLKTIEGTLEEAEESLQRFDSKGGRELTPWVELIIQTERVIPQLDVQLKEFTKEMNLELLKIKLLRDHYSLDNQIEEVDLSSLEITEVFRKKCESYGSPPEEMEELLATFTELQEWMNEDSFI
ncbi:MAG: exonuclease SbcCD subunit D C-terminal domain-containing protein [Saprospiraceae bacterium]